MEMLQEEERIGKAESPAKNRNTSITMEIGVVKIRWNLIRIGYYSNLTSLVKASHDPFVGNFRSILRPISIAEKHPCLCLVDGG